MILHLLRSFAKQLCFLLLMAGMSTQPASAEERRQLSGGWTHYAPYSYIETVRGFPVWKGFDVELLREISERAGYAIDSPRVEWAEHVRGIENGTRDVAPNATFTHEREEFAYFSTPYRNETLALIVPRGESASLSAKSDDELVSLFKDEGFRVGVKAGFAYPSKLIRDYLDDPDFDEQIVRAESQQDLLQDLIDGRTDGYLSDRIVAATFIVANNAHKSVEPHSLTVAGDLHLMFSKASVSPEVVEDFNRAIESLKEDGTFRRLTETYTFPITVSLTLDSDWFFIVDIIGTIAFAFSGLLLAYRYHYDIFGALVLASLPAVGGGAVRDLLTTRETLAVLSDPIYIEIVIVLVAGGYLIIQLGMAMQRSGAGSAAFGFMERRRDQLGYLVQVFDGIGLAAFTVTGVVVAIGTRSTPLWLWGPILAAVTAAGGGILRDVVRSDPDVPSLKGELYPEIAIVWGLILSLYLSWQTRHLDPDRIAIGIIVTVVGTFVTRIAVIHFGIRSPLFSFRT